MSDKKDELSLAFIMADIQRESETLCQVRLIFNGGFDPNYYISVIKRKAKRSISKIPFVGNLMRKIYRKLFRRI